MPAILLILPVLSTLAGGLLAMRLRRWLPLLMALGAGLLLGAAFLDLLPEALVLGSAAWHGGVNGVGPGYVLGVALVSFLGFFALESWLRAAFGLPGVGEIGAGALGQGSAGQVSLGKVGGAMLIFHSLRDGMAIGVAYAASHPVGYAVAAGIVAHDLGDGMNTVILTSRGAAPRLSDYLFLASDALAPLLGGLLTFWWTLGGRSSVALLAVTAGFFLQMVSSEFLPELRAERRAGMQVQIVAAVLAGAGVIFLANALLATVQ